MNMFYIFYKSNYLFTYIIYKKIIHNDFEIGFQLLVNLGIVEPCSSSFSICNAEGRSS